MQAPAPRPAGTLARTPLSILRTKLSDTAGLALDSLGDLLHPQ